MGSGRMCYTCTAIARRVRALEPSISETAIVVSVSMNGFQTKCYVLHHFNYDRHEVA